MKYDHYLEKITYAAITLGFTIAWHQESTLTATLAMYALSGALTNSLAIVMIFEKIPGVIGSGIIEKNFKSFQKKLKDVLIEHLFQDGLNIVSFNTQSIGQSLYTKLSSGSFSILTQFITQEKLIKLLDEADIGSLINSTMDKESIESHLDEQIAKLSPEEIKSLILHIMHEHLQFLVVWGAIFGAVMGLIAYATI